MLLAKSNYFKRVPTFANCGSVISLQPIAHWQKHDIFFFWRTFTRLQFHIFCNSLLCYNFCQQKSHFVNIWLVSVGSTVRDPYSSLSRVTHWHCLCFTILRNAVPNLFPTWFTNFSFLTTKALP